ncbi:hypothetical protein FG386_000674 [Cryptosporidium ryanae]|uniref:uncharacterized protein n=1 Tax=Cryptosporidium ryanae TaxID=515981 RepID=UPI00351A126E|nr:hypothetical protein FG386_000674 [Cryptosporidium ryanae]
MSFMQDTTPSIHIPVKEKPNSLEGLDTFRKKGKSGAIRAMREMHENSKWEHIIGHRKDVSFRKLLELDNLYL